MFRLIVTKFDAVSGTWIEDVHDEYMDYREAESVRDNLELLYPEWIKRKGSRIEVVQARPFIHWMLVPSRN